MIYRAMNYILAKINIYSSMDQIPLVTYVDETVPEYEEDKENTKYGKAKAIHPTSSYWRSAY